MPAVHKEKTSKTAKKRDCSISEGFWPIYWLKKCPGKQLAMQEDTSRTG
jgi:hypothetical protein